jgi:hypothetical protein
MTKERARGAAGDARSSSRRAVRRSGARRGGLDHGPMRLTAFALAELSSRDEAGIGVLVKRAPS